MTVVTNKNRKRISISSKRQITLPNAFYVELGFENEAECILNGNELIIRPIHSNTYGEFGEEILADLIKEGYSGEKMLEEFRIRQAKMKASIGKMLADADAVAEGKSEYMTMDDVFDEK